jgi:ArsR family transcriptional regulator, lead/cadmium/zinc/bismuth-responsive transcriptional repressor
MIYNVLMDDRCDLLCVDAPKAEAIRQSLLDEGGATRAAGRAQALSDPTRLMLASALQQGEELCVCDLSWIAERKQALVSHHLRTLRAVGLVRSRREGKLVFYTLTDEGRALLEVVLGEPMDEPTKVQP